jgi:hypothetical protein
MSYGYLHSASRRIDSMSSTGDFSVNRIISNLTAFVFGLIFAAMLFLAALPKAHGAEPVAQTWIGIIVFYQDGKVVNSESIGYAANQQNCIQGVMSILPIVAAKNVGFGLSALCTVAPPAPPTPDLPPQSKTPLPHSKGEDRV